MPQDTEVTKVIFRMFPNGDLLALFPDLPGTNDIATCASYMHIGQHGAASVNLANMRAALPQEYSELKKELELIGYRLTIVRRFTRASRAARLKEINRTQ